MAHYACALIVQVSELVGCHKIRAFCTCSDTQIGDWSNWLCWLKPSVVVQYLRIQVSCVMNSSEEF